MRLVELVRVGFVPVVLVALTSHGAAKNVASAVPGPATGAGHHCLDEARSKWVLHHLVVGQLNPLGAEATIRLGFCSPLFRSPGILFSLTHVEAGLLTNVAPSYVQLGGYAQIVPLSMLVLRSEFSRVRYFPFPYDRSGYFPLAGYDAAFTNAALPARDAQSADGWNLNLIGVLRGYVPVSTSLSIALYSAWSSEYFSIGNAAYYLNVRRDMPLSRSDWIINNETAALFEKTLTPQWRVLAGVFNAWRTVPSSGYTVNQVGVVVGVNAPAPTGIMRTMRDMQILVRLGRYTAHRYRDDELSALLVLFASHDLSAR
jgi:hypothetical protein